MMQFYCKQSTRGMVDGRCLESGESFPRPLAPSVIAAALITVIVNGVLILNNGCLDATDDYTMATMLNTLYPINGQQPFSNALLNALIFQLNSCFPVLNWFVVIERASSTLGFFLVSYLTIRYAPLSLGLVTAGACSFFVLPMCTVGSNFTVVAAICVFAGELCCLYGAAYSRRTLVVPGVFMAVLGALWRLNILLLSLPFFIVSLGILGSIISRQSFSVADLFARLKPGLVGIVSITILVLFAFSINAVVWSQPPWSDWRGYSDSRSMLVDYPVKPYEEIADELDSVGISENDYFCMTHWINGDKSFFTQERLASAAEIASDSKNIGWLKAIKEEGKRILDDRAFVLAGIGLLLLVAVRCDKRVLLVALGSFAGALLICFYFRYTGRLPVRVEYPIWLFSLLPLFVAIFVWPRVRTRRIQVRKYVGACISAIYFLVCVGVVLVQWVPTFSFERCDQFSKENSFVAHDELIQQFMNQDLIFIWDGGSFNHSIERSLLYKYLPPEDLVKSNVLLGGWPQGSPQVESLNSSIGIENPIRSLVERDDVRFVISSRFEGTVRLIEKYLQEHYDPSTSYVVENTVSYNGRTEEESLLVVEYEVK